MIQSESIVSGPFFILSSNLVLLGDITLSHSTPEEKRETPIPSREYWVYERTNTVSGLSDVDDLCAIDRSQ
jgi:hypothetical protein